MPPSVAVVPFPSLIGCRRVRSRALAERLGAYTRKEMAGRGLITGEVWQIPCVAYELVERRRCLEDITGGVGASPSWMYVSLRHPTTNIRRKDFLVSRTGYSQETCTTQSLSIQYAGSSIAKPDRRQRWSWHHNINRRNQRAPTTKPAPATHLHNHSLLKLLLHYYTTTIPLPIPPPPPPPTTTRWNSPST